MEIQRDFRELLELFGEHKTKLLNKTNCLNNPLLYLDFVRKGMKAFRYDLPVEKIINESEFNLILINYIFGEREIKIMYSDIK
ncbi:hypothetical protein DRQ33_03260 [bacterium]|nr:MAG: hypothetical protein DRQ33_03260 [bacterium]